jgi:hypothetical protein
MVRGARGMPPGAAPAPPAIQAFAAALQQAGQQRLMSAAQRAAQMFARAGLGQWPPGHTSTPPTGYRPGPWTYYDPDEMGQWPPGHASTPPTGYRPGPWTYYDPDEGMGRFRYSYPRHPAHHAIQRMSGLGAASVQIVDGATEAEIAASLPGQAALLAATEAQPDGSRLTVGDVRTRARRVNYALSHLGEPNMGRRRVAERLMAFKKALGIADPPGSIINEALRQLLAAQGGITPGAVPTLDAIAAKLPRGPGAASGAAAPGGAPYTPTTTTGAPAAPVQVSPAPAAAAAAAAAGTGPGPSVPTQVVPPPTSTKRDATTWAILAVLAIAFYRMHRRRGG